MSTTARCDLMPDRRIAALSALGAGLAEADDLDELGSVYLDLARTVIDMPMRAIYLFGGHGISPPSWSRTHNVSNRFLTEYERHGRCVDPELRQVISTGMPTYNLARRTVEQWRRTEIYQRVDRIENMLHTLKAPILLGGAVIGTIDFATDRLDTEVTAADFALLGGLASTVGCAMRAMSRRRATEERLGVALATLDVAGVPVVSTGVPGGPLETTRAAADLMRRIDGGPAAVRDLVEGLARLPRSGTVELAVPVRLTDGVGDVLLGRLRPVPDGSTTVIAELSLKYSGDTIGDERLEVLSAREREVAALVVAGYSDKEIADELVLSLHTVRQHVKHIYTKLGTVNRVQLTRVYYGMTAQVTTTQAVRSVAAGAR